MKRTRVETFGRLLALGLGLFFPANLALAELATVYLKGGESMTVELVSADRGQIQWKISPTARDVQMILRSEVDYVIFPTTPEWREAEELKESGKIQEAIAAYQKVVADPAGHYYPFPGNYTSLAMERLLRCYRDLMDIPRIAQQAAAVRTEFLNLPPDMREVDPLNLAWVAVAEKEWEKVLEEASKADPPTTESFFLQGRALEEMGRKAESIQAYAGVYTLNFGGNVLYTRTALERSALQLAELGEPLREIELIAQLKLYRDLFGKGKLWEGASEKLTQLADGEIQTLGEPEGEMAKLPERPTGGPGTVLEQKGVTMAASTAGNRDYLLFNELPEKAFVLGGGAGPTQVEVVSGSAASDSGYLFDGTGGGLRLPGVDGSKPVVVLRLRFSPENPDGAIFELGNKDGGMGVYVAGGKLIVLWSPKGGAKMTRTVGDVSVGSQNQLQVQALNKEGGGGNLIVEFNGERVVFPLQKPGLSLVPDLSAFVGDVGVSGGDSSIDGKKHPPFEGSIEHISIATGASLKVIADEEIARFGKVFHLSPPAG